MGAFFDLALLALSRSAVVGQTPPPQLYNILGLYAVSLFKGAVHLAVTLHFLLL